MCFGFLPDFIGSFFRFFLDLDLGLPDEEPFGGLGRNMEEGKRALPVLGWTVLLLDAAAEFEDANPVEGGAK